MNAVRRSAADRQKRTRARRALGLVSCRIDVDEHAVAAALVVTGRLTADEALRRSLVERELAEVIVDWAARWLADRHV